MALLTLPENALLAIVKMLGTDYEFVLRNLCKDMKMLVDTLPTKTKTSTRTDAKILTTESLIKWALDGGLNPLNLAYIIGKSGNLDLVDWFMRKHLLHDYTVICRFAAKFGHLHVLRYLYDKKACKLDAHAHRYAAESGNVELLKWLHEKLCPPSTGACTVAARLGHLHALQLLRKNKCPWDKWTCIFAGHMGRLHVLKWAKDNGCPWFGRGVYLYASQTGQQHVMDWINENGFYYND